jgi:hypothetical protein
VCERIPVRVRVPVYNTVRTRDAAGCVRAALPLPVAPAYSPGTVHPRSRHTGVSMASCRLQHVRSALQSWALPAVAATASSAGALPIVAIIDMENKDGMRMY